MVRAVVVGVVMVGCAAAPPPSPPIATPRAPVVFSPVDEARRHFRRAQLCVQQLDCQCAAREFELANTIKPNPASMFNAARAYADCASYEPAIKWYSAYLATDPDDAEWVRDEIARLQRRIDNACTPIDKVMGLCKHL